MFKFFREYIFAKKYFNKVKKDSVVLCIKATYLLITNSNGYVSRIKNCYINTLTGKVLFYYYPKTKLLVLGEMASDLNLISNTQQYYNLIELLNEIEDGN